MIKKVLAYIKMKGTIGVVAAVLAAGTVTGVVAKNVIMQPERESVITKEVETAELMEAKWPESFEREVYVEPSFMDDENRINQAFNVADFGAQGNNGWFYRYGDPLYPTMSKQMEGFDGERYFQVGAEGLEVKKDFYHTANGNAAILEWRAAQTGEINLLLTYVKNVNGDKNPSYPDGVYVYIYKGEELLERHQVEVYVDKETLLETAIESLPVEEGESLYIVVDDNENNAYDGGLLYVAVEDANAEEPAIGKDATRTDNNADFVQDYGKQGSNGWYYGVGKSIGGCKIAPVETAEGYMNYTSPALQISSAFVHPAINDDAIIWWEPAMDGQVEIRGTYTKFEQNDGNPAWPDGVTVGIYHNNQKLYEKSVLAPDSGNETISFRLTDICVTAADELYFVVDANNNASYDGGCFEIEIIDRTAMGNENSVEIDRSETRQNMACAECDFGSQGNNGWFFQEGYQDEPFGAYNILAYIKDDKYIDEKGLEIKRDFINVGKNGRSAVIKWKVAQTGKIAIDADYTKLKNEDVNPSWPDGTRVSLYHNETLLRREEFAPDTTQEITKDLSIDSLQVEQGDYITMVVNGMSNPAYDGGKYHFAIRSLSGLVGITEVDYLPDESDRTNNANIMDDFGVQGRNGWFYQYGYETSAYYAVNLEQRIEEDDDKKYISNTGVEIKKDYIMPGKCGRSANVKWVVAEDGVINIYASYKKLLNEDANPSWPDGVWVTLLHNTEVLKEEYFAAETEYELMRPLIVKGLKVSENDRITLIVDSGKNPAYDGGIYTFEIEDAERVILEKKNDNENNYANLAVDFGEQGSNGWYYLEGETVDADSALTKKTEDGTGYLSKSQSSLEMKKDYVQPGARKKAMYQWVVATDGKIDVTGSYVKFGHNDPNASWPDGTQVEIYLNKTLLESNKVEAKQGDGNDNELPIDMREIEVKKGDLITFAIGSGNNTAWDGGRLSVQIIPSGSEIPYLPAPDNTANLAEEFGEQGSNGWYYGTCDWNGTGFAMLPYDAQKQSFCNNGKPELGKDFVEPGRGLNAAYKWIAGEDGRIVIEGEYTKFANAEDAEANGVCLRIFQNLEEKKWIGDGINRGGLSSDVTVTFKQELEVKRGDEIIFAVNPEGNDSYDGGRLAINISPKQEVAEPEYVPAPDNTANLAEEFGEQGSNGWYYGTCDWNGTGFTMLAYDAENQRYFNDGKPELKRDFVEPGKGLNAAYKWVAGEDGIIVIEGEYTKFANAEDPNADGVCLRIFQNLQEKKWIGDGIMGQGISSEVTTAFTQELEVKRGDQIIFAVNPEGNDSYDGGRLSVRISPKSEEVSDPLVEPEYVPAPDNTANLAEEFGEQGSNGWYYGTCEWNGVNFTKLPYDAENQRYFNDGKPELKRDFVEPGKGLNAAYKWVAGEDGIIVIEGEYTKFANAEDPNADGVCLRIFQNLQEKKWIGDGIMGQGIGSEVTTTFTQELEVKRGDEIIFAVNPEGNDSYDGGRLSIQISPKSE